MADLWKFFSLSPFLGVGLINPQGFNNCLPSTASHPPSTLQEPVLSSSHPMCSPFFLCAQHQAQPGLHLFALPFKLLVSGFQSLFYKYDMFHYVNLCFFFSDSLFKSHFPCLPSFAFYSSVFPKLSHKTLLMTPWRSHTQIALFLLLTQSMEVCVARTEQC